MSNQNKKTSNFFWAKNLENSCFFVKSSSNAPTGVDKKTQNKQKSNSGSILYSYIPQNLEYDAEI